MTATSHVDPGIAPFLARVNDRTSSRAATLTDARRVAHRLAEIVALKPPIEMYSVQDTAIRGPSTDIALRVYRPTERPAPTQAATTWVADHIRDYGGLAGRLAVAGGLPPVSRFSVRNETPS